MKIYRVNTTHYPTQDAAKKAAKAAGAQFEPIDFSPKLADVVDYLNTLEAEVARRPTEIEPLGPGPQAGIVQHADGRTRVLQLDEAWDAAPLAMQLHYAAMAVEAARDGLRCPKVVPPAVEVDVVGTPEADDTSDLL